MTELTNTRNPILPPEIHVPDCEAHVMSDGNLYIYGSFDDHEIEYCSDVYHVVSTSDMEHWTVHDTSMTGENVPWFNDPDAPKYVAMDSNNLTPFMKSMGRSFAWEYIKKRMKKFFSATSKEEQKNRPYLYAPDCIEKDGKFYLYFCMADGSEGVAVSDNPQGPFENPVQLSCGGIDPAIFVDDDGQAYYYWAQFRSKGAKLNPDMVSLAEDTTVENLITEEEHYFHEGSSMRKIGDTYYYVYADMERGKPTSLGYSTSRSPLGPFTYQGILIDNDGCDPASWNNHGSIECFHGQWYVFYHRSSQGTKIHRRLCIEPITINPDGTINEVKMTSQGVGAPFAPGETIMGYQACGLKGSVYIGPGTGQSREAGLENVGKNEYTESLINIKKGDEIIFRYVKSDREWTGIEMECRGTGEVKVYMNDTLAGIAAGLPDARTNQVICGEISMPAGEYEVRLQVCKAKKLEITKVRLK